MRLVGDAPARTYVPGTGWARCRGAVGASCNYWKHWAPLYPIYVEREIFHVNT